MLASLTDLLEQVDLAALHGVPEPQRRALEVALLRADAAGVRVEPRAIATGVLSTLRVLSEGGSVVVAIDDLQWLDGPSADALTFAVRRLADGNPRYLFARRPGRAGALEAATGADDAALDIRPLSLGAVRALLFDRLGLAPPRRILRQVYDTAGGNPLFALEIGRVLAARGTPAIGEELPVPDAIDELLGVRVDQLPEELRKLLLAVSLSPGLHVAQVQALGSGPAFEESMAQGLLSVEHDRVRASHPLLAAAARRRSRPRERREIHRELAGAATSDARRVRHLALATEGKDLALAETIAAAAANASARGARQEAAELADHALRLTPPDTPEHTERLLALGRYLESAGEKRRVTELVSKALESLPPGSARADAYMMLTGGDVADNAEIRRYLELALAESAAAPDIRSAALSQLAVNDAVILVERVAEADATVPTSARRSRCGA